MLVYFSDSLSITESIGTTTKSILVVDTLEPIELISVFPFYESSVDELLIRENIRYHFPLRSLSIQESTATVSETIKRRLTDQTVTDEGTITEYIEDVITEASDSMEIAEAISLMYAVRNYNFEDEASITETQTAELYG